MNEVEYVLRIILKARDELAGALKKAREELRLFASAADGNKSKIDAFNTSIEKMDKNVTNITNKFREWRAVVEGSGKEQGDLNRSMASLNTEIEKNVQKTGRAAKGYTELRARAQEANVEAKALHAEYKRSGADADYLISQLKGLGTELETLSKKFKANSQASQRAFDWSRNARKLAADIKAIDDEITKDAIEESNKRVRQAEKEAEEKKKAYDAAVKDLHDTVDKEISEAERGRKVTKAINEAEIADDVRVTKSRIDATVARTAADKKAAEERVKTEKKANADAVKDFVDSIDKEIAAIKKGRQVTKQINDEETRDHKRAIDARAVETARGIELEARLRKQSIQEAIKDTVDFFKVQIDETRKANTVTKRLRDEDERDRKRRVADEAAEAAKAADHRVNIAKAETRAIEAQRRAGDVRERLSQRRGRAVDPSLASDARAASDELKRLSTVLKEDSDLSETLRHESEGLSVQLRQTQRDADRTGGSFKGLNEWLDKNSDSVAGLDNTLRGIGWLAVAGFANQFITILGGLAGQFVAVAASAAQAGAAIGGAFVAGVGQALPSLGLLAGALVRVQSVMDAVKQSQTAQQAAAVQGAGASRRVADATDTVRNAQEALATAQRRVKDAQEGLTQARKDARDELQDLIQAERDAELAAVGAALSQKEAQQALISAQARGDTEGIARAELRVLEAKADAEQAITDKRRARREAERGEAGGVEGTEGVEQAKRALEDAGRAAEKAGRGIETAKRNASEAAAGTQTAAATLNYLLSQLSPAELRLYKALKNIQEAYKNTYRPITDLIVNSFARSVDRVSQIIQMPKVVDLARKTARTLSQQMNNVFDGLTDDKMIAQFIRIGEAGRKNLKPLADIALSVGKSLANIAEDAGPAFSKMLRFVRGLVQQFEDLTGRRQDMREFFLEGEKHFEAWIKLGLSVIQLFMALAGAGGAESGLTSIKDATKAIDELTDKVNANKGDVAAFFEDARKIAYEVVDVLAVLATELSRVFTPERISHFTDLIKTVLIPGLVDAIELFGQISTFLLKIADTPFGKQVLQFGVALFFVSKIVSSTFGVIGQFIKGLGFLFGPVFSFIGKMFPALNRIATLLRFIAPQLARAALGAVAPWALLIGAIVFLLAKLGLLDDAWREVKSAFNAFWQEVEPSVKKLVDAFSELWEAVSEGKGLFGLIIPVLRVIMRVLVGIGGIFLRVFGRALGRIIGGVIDVLTGLINFITGVFTGDWSKAWRGIRQIFGGIFRAVFSVVRMLPDLLVEIGKKILPALRRGITGLWEWLRGLPKRLGNLAAEGAKAVVNAFKNVGGEIIKAIGQGLRASGGFAKDLVNGIIDMINEALPNKIDVPGPLGSINLPNNPIQRLAAGGPVLGSGKGDIVGAWLEPGEHVLTKQEVAAMGGHGAVFALRRTLGGGGQGGSGRFQRGGRVSGAGGLTIEFEGGSLDDFQSQWRLFWNSLVVTTRRGASLIEKSFRDMRVATTRSADRMYRDVRKSLDNIENSFDARGKRIVNSWADTWQSLKKVTHDGLFYIGHETNKALTTLGEKALHFHLEEPKKADAGKAGGGWIGSKGQRGRDMGFYPLGAGEAVLNWQHQRYVEPAMNAYYGHGLTDMFNRVHGYHAGGGGTGFAGGRPAQFGPIPGMPGEEANTRVIPLIMKLIRQYHAVITDAYDRDRSAGHKSPGHNVTGTAIDAVPSSPTAAGWNAIEAMGRWAVSQGMTVGYGAGVPGSQNWAGHGRDNHIHIELGSNPSAAAAFLTKIVGPMVKGGGVLADLSQAAIDLVLKAANGKLTETFAAVPGDTNFPLGPGGAAQKVFDFFTGRGLSDAIAAGFVGTFQKESNFVTTVTNAAGSGATGLAQWLGGRLATLQAKPNWQSLQTQLNYVWEELLGSESAAFAQIKTARTPEEAATIIDSQYERSDNILSAPANARAAYEKFHGTGKPRKYAAGGIVPGPEGSPVPILAHAQEWILNSGQVNRLASMIGTSRSALRSMMGFYGGGAGGFQGGGEAGDIKDLTTADVKGIDPAGLRKLVVLLRRIGRNIDSAAVGMGSVETWSGYLDKSAAQLRRLSRRLGARIAKGDEGTALRGFLDGMDKLLGENGPFAKMRAAIERQTTRAATRLTRRGLAGGVLTDEVQSTRRDVRVARLALRQTRDLQPALEEERSDIARSLRQVRGAQEKKGLTPRQKRRLQGQENQLIAALDEAGARVVDNLQAINDAAIALQEAKDARGQAVVDEINKRAEADLAKNEFSKRIASALGQGGIVASLNRAQADILARQANELERTIQGLRDAGSGELADQITNQVEELRTQVTELTAQALRDSIDAVNATAQRKLAFIDIAGRVTDVLERAGGRQAAAGQRVTQARERGAAFATQRADLEVLRNQAIIDKNTGAQEDLNLQIAELDATIAENNQTTQELIIANHQLTAEIIKGTRERTTGFLGIGQSILEKLGILDPAKTLPFLKAIGKAISDEAISLVEEIRKAIDNPDNPFGQFAARAEPLLADAVAAFLRGPEAFAQWLLENAPVIAKLIEDMGGASSPMGSLFGGMIDGLGDNTLAMLDNTKAIDEANGIMKDPQTFSSTAWQWFNEAVFTGMGQVLTQYDPSMMGVGGGADAMSGVAGINTGAVVTPSVTTSSTQGGDTNINVYEAGRPVDVQEISGAVTFASKTTQ